MRQGEPIPGIIESLSQKLGISRQRKGAEARLLHTCPDVSIDRMDLRWIHLVNFDTVRSSRADLLIRRGGPGAENKRRFRFVASSGSGNLSIRRSHSLESSRGHANRRIDLRAQYLSLCAFPLAVIHEGRLLQLYVSKNTELLLEGDFIVGAGVEIVIGMSEEARLSQLLVVSDFVETLVVVLGLSEFHIVF